MIDQVTIASLLDLELYKKYYSFVLKAFVDKNTNIRWCPAKRCENAIQSPVKNSMVVCPFALTDRFSHGQVRLRAHILLQLLEGGSLACFVRAAQVVQRHPREVNGVNPLTHSSQKARLGAKLGGEDHEVAAGVHPGLPQVQVPH